MIVDLFLCMCKCMENSRIHSALLFCSCSGSCRYTGMWSQRKRNHIGHNVCMCMSCAYIHIYRIRLCTYMLHTWQWDSRKQRPRRVSGWSKLEEIRLFTIILWWDLVPQTRVDSFENIHKHTHTLKFPCNEPFFGEVFKVFLGDAAFIRSRHTHVTYMHWNSVVWLTLRWHLVT